MKILCETQVINRQNPTTQTNRIRTLKATLAVGFHPPAKENSELQILHFTPQCKTGFRYKVKGNIEKIYTKFINDGKATISFKNPEQDLMIKCDPIQLKGFLRTLKLGLDGKSSFHLKLNSGSLAAIPVKHHPVTKLVVTSRSDYPVKGFPKSLKSLSVNGISLSKMSFEICSLRNLTTLNFSDNEVIKIPPELGRLSLVDINISNNQVGELNNWQWLKGNALRKSLNTLDISGNNLTHFPIEIVKLSKLVTLKLNNNSITRIPFAIRRLKNLRFLHLSSNKLESLPSSLNEIRLDTLDVWANNFQPKSEIEPPPMQCMDTASPLWLIAARVVTAQKLCYSSATLPWTLVDIISEAPICTCGRLCFSADVLDRAMVATLDHVKHLVFSRNRVIYSDIVSCSVKCANRNSVTWMSSDFE